MKQLSFNIICLAVIAYSSMAYCQAVRSKSDYPLAPLTYKDVQISDAFWTPRLENNRTVSIPGLFDRYEKTNHGPDLRLVEAACYELAKRPDPALKARIDSKLDNIIEQIRSRKQKWSTEGDGDTLWAGNFLEVSVAYYEATGSRKLLDAAIEIADDLNDVFGPNKRHDISNHEGIKMGLVRLYRCTGEDKYLQLAKFFLDSRGNPAGRSGLYGPYAQDQQPVKSQTRAIGHCVRATYLYIPLTDIAQLTADADYVRADQRIWEDAVSKRTYLTGGIGSYRDEEDYGDDFDLPNLNCWNETCAAFGNIFWNQKLFLLNQDAKYIDLMERTLYNAFLAGVSLGGDTYLYQTPLKTYGNFARQGWFGPNCCPPNVARLLPQLGNLIYAQGPESLYVNLFIGGKAETKLGDTPLSIAQETNYPWDGAVKIAVNPQKPRKFAVYVRIPGWSRNQPMPGLLYRYLPVRDEPISLSINGGTAPYTMEKGYAKIEREWKTGDHIQLDIPMIVRRVVAADQVADDRGMVALERGPLVFCAEQVDNPSGVFSLQLGDEETMQFALGGVKGFGKSEKIGAITGNAFGLSRSGDGARVVTELRAFTAIPYYAFANRSPGEMSVWLARTGAKAIIAPKTSIASTSRASSSCGNGTVAENYPGHNPPSIAHGFIRSPRTEAEILTPSAIRSSL